MTEVWLDPEPAAVLAQLQADPSRAELHSAVNRVLDALEHNPADAVLRRRRFHQPPVWCVLVATPKDRWVILWESHPAPDDAVAIRHIGPASFA